MGQSLNNAAILVVGAGIMGAGIAQIAAQAGHQVLLYDVGEGAAASAIEKLSATFDKLVGKGKISAESATVSLANIRVANTLEDCASVALVVEAIVENLAIKQQLFADLESVVSADCVLATNTSSISVTAIANGMQHPERLVGMHFFNPAPIMKLVEVVSGLQTAIEAVGESAGLCAFNPRFYRQPYCTTILRRNAGAVTGASEHTDGIGCVHQSSWIPHGAMSANGFDWPRY